MDSNLVKGTTGCEINHQ